MAEDRSAGEPDARELDRALHYWQTIRGDRVIPLRAEFDPFALPDLTPHIVFLEVVDGGRDFRFKVIGHACRAAFFENWTGRLVSSLPHVEPDGTLLTNLRRAVDDRTPVLEPAEYVGPLKEFRTNREILLPLGDEAGRVTHIAAYILLVRRDL